ncbi:MAG: RluA family pseudouridine synthase [Anaerovoracaceae bacterium]|nr:RluA family pseudouridine synthase [Bacillota bacterium]MDY2670889.1 RluA family pseudouridine synthase [Anaerovoracaceae bacterium]
MQDSTGQPVRITIEENEKGRRLDAVLSDRFADQTRSYIQKLLADGCVTASAGAKAVKNYKVRPGDLFEVSLPEPELLDVEPEDIPLDIVYEDDDLIVVNKPQGMVVHPAPGNPDGTLVNALMYHCGDSLSTINGVIRPGIVHRIDKDTSGLLVAAKSDRAHEGLAEQFAVHSITRRYRAVVYNNIKEDEGTVDANIGRSSRDRKKMAVVPSGKGRHAVTHYRVLDRAGSFTYIECVLETGRTHQIRVHMASKGHPLLGDPLYGPKKHAFGIEGQVLHAKVLGFIHPVTGEKMLFDSQLPDHFIRAMKQAGFKTK